MLSVTVMEYVGIFLNEDGKGRDAEMFQKWGVVEVKQKILGRTIRLRSTA